MRYVLLAVAVALGALVSWLALTPVPFQPVAWAPGPNPGKEGPFAANAALSAARAIPLGAPDARGPEDVALGPDGLLYTGLADGRIVRLPPAGGPLETLANTGGRPLGLEFDATGTLVIADAEKGLLALAPDGALRVLTDSVNGERMKFVDDLAIAADGTVWFSDASMRYGVADSIYDFFEGRATGRLIAWNPATGETKVHLDGLGFANGVALGPDEAYVLVNETMRYRITRYWLKGPKAGTAEPFIENLPGFPDNLTYDGRGTFWVAMFMPRNPLLDGLAPYPALRGMAYTLISTIAGPGGAVEPHGWVIGLDTEGRVVANLQSSDGTVAATTSVNRAGDALYVGSLEGEAIRTLPVPAR